MSLFSKPKDVVDRALAGSEASTPRPAPEIPGDPRAVRRRTIGQLLRETRERQGAEISRVATALRIKAAQIEAIEEGHYDRLPGVVYALGFVRAYATHLGLDGEEAVRRFKLEAEGFDDQRDLAFPVPLAERSIPGGVMMLTALLFAICAYGVWYYLSAAALPRLDRVSAVPSELLPHPASPAPAAAAEGDKAAAAPASDAPASSSTASAPPAAPAAAPSVAAAPESPAPSPAAPVTPPRPAAEARPQPASPAPPAPRPAAIAEAPSTAEPSAAPANPSATSAVPDVPQAGAPAAPEPPKAYGTTNGNARVIIRATADSWIQVRSADQTPIFTRELHAGDTYRVPDQPGVNMRTGKASVLAITVDGRAAPPIRGGVRLNVILDPDRLLAGNAAE